MGRGVTLMNKNEYKDKVKLILDDESKTRVNKVSHYLMIYIRISQFHNGHFTILDSFPHFAVIIFAI